MEATSDCSIALSWSNAILSIIFTVIFFLSALGNSIVIVTILKRQKRSVRSITNLYLLNLSMADLLRSVICMPSTLLSELSQCWLLGPFMCKIAAYLQPVAVCASAYTLAIIAVERYFAICRPLQSRKWHSKRHAVSMISFVWFVSFLSNSGSLAIFDAVPYKTAWNCRSMASPLVDFFYQVYVTLILLLIPLTIMTVLYGNVIFTLKTGIRFDMNLTVSVNSLECPNNIFELSGNGSASAGWLLDAMLFPTWATKPFSDMNTSGLSSLKVPGFPLSRSHTASFSMSPNGSSFHSKRLMSVFSTSSVSFLYNTRRRSGDVDNSYLLRSTHQEKILMAKKRVTRMLIILVIAYVICWTPSFVWWLLIKTTDLVDAPSFWNSSVNTVITVLTYISTCTNPITYCFMNASFRKSVFSHWLCCAKRCCESRSPQQLMIYPQRRRTQSATPRLNSVEDNGAAADELSKGPISNVPKPVPEIQIQFFGSQRGGSAENKSFEIDEQSLPTSRI